MKQKLIPKKQIGKFQTPWAPLSQNFNYKDATGNPYKVIKDGKKGAMYDALNAGLYLAAPFTGGATILPAMSMSGLKGAYALGDMAENGVTPNNFMDAITGVFPLPWGPYLKQVSNNARVARNTAKLFKNFGNNARDYIHIPTPDGIMSMISPFNQAIDYELKQTAKKTAKQELQHSNVVSMFPAIFPSLSGTGKYVTKDFVDDKDNK